MRPPRAAAGGPTPSLSLEKQKAAAPKTSGRFFTEAMLERLERENPELAKQLRQETGEAAVSAVAVVSVAEMGVVRLLSVGFVVFYWPPKRRTTRRSTRSGG